MHRFFSSLEGKLTHSPLKGNPGKNEAGSAPRRIRPVWVYTTLLQPEMVLCSGGLVDPTLEHSPHCNARQCVVCLIFGGERFVESIGVFWEFEAFSKGGSDPISGDFVVFDPVERRDQNGVTDATGSGPVHPFFGFADQAAHGFTLFATGIQPVLEEEFLEASPLFAALAKLTIQSLAELVIGGPAGQFGERGDKLGFSTEEISQLIVVKLFEVRCHGFEGLLGDRMQCPCRWNNLLKISGWWRFRWAVGCIVQSARKPVRRKLHRLGHVCWKHAGFLTFCVVRVGTYS